MTLLAEPLSHATLSWVMPELERMLCQIRASIESFAEAPQQADRIRDCAAGLHQVGGVLRVLELAGPALVAAELESLAEALAGARIDARDEACALLMRGSMLLPDYLESLQSGHRDIPLVLLPLLNELRLAQALPVLEECVLRTLDPQWQDATAPELEHARGSLSGRNRELLDTVASAVKEELLRVKDALDLYLRTGGEVVALRPQVAELDAIADTLEVLGLEPARAVVMQQRQTLAAIVEDGRQADEALLLDIAGALLYVDASLDDQVMQLGADRGDAAGANAAALRHTLEALVHEALADFAAAREHVVAFVETGWDHQRLFAVPALFDEVGGALRILGLSEPADCLLTMRRYVQQGMIDLRWVPDARQLDALADAMTSLEYYLEALRERRPGCEAILAVTRRSVEALRCGRLSASPGDAVGVSEQWTLAAVGGDDATDAGQGAANAAAREVTDVVEAAAGGGSGLAEQTLSPPQTSPMSDGAAAPVSTSAWQRDADDVDIATETAASSLADSDAQRGAENFACSPGRDLTGPTPESETDGAVVTPTKMASDREHPAAATVEDESSAAEDFIDDEIRAVFFEEFEEERSRLAQLLAVWRLRAENGEHLRAIRRIFHTLKGSGHLVGLHALGEFCWRIENLLNHVLDGRRASTQAVLAVVDGASALLPALSEAVRQGVGLPAAAQALQTLADRVADGEEAFAVTADESDAGHDDDHGVGSVAEDTDGSGPADQEVGTPAQIDPVLGEILEAEVTVHQATVQAWLDHARLTPTLASEALLRAMHTMNGAFAMAEVPEITAATGAAESYVQRLLAAACTADEDGVQAIADTCAAVADTIAALQAPSPRVPVVVALADRLRQLIDTLPPAPWPTPAMVEATAADMDMAGELPFVASAGQGDAPSPLAIDLDGDAWPDVDASVSAPVPPAAPVLPGQPTRTSDESVAETATVPDEGARAKSIVALAIEAEIAVASDVRPPVATADPASDEATAGTIAEALPSPVAVDSDASTCAPARNIGTVATAVNTSVPDSAASDTATPGSTMSDTHVSDSQDTADDIGLLDFQTLDRELVDLFLGEGRELIDHGDGLLADLRQTPSERAPLIGLQRDLHTLKGGARMAGISAIGDLAHGVESLLDALVDQQHSIDTADIDLLERGFDRLHQLLSLTDAQRQVATPTALIAVFEQRARDLGRGIGAGARPSAMPPAVADSAALTVRAPSEQVRVRADLMDRLVNHAGEMAIYRSRLEQQLGSFRGTMAELDRTNTRLRDQLRRLDMETEAQIVARYQREQEQGEHEFDPLELDRFSTLQQLSRALNESAADLAGLQGVLDDLARQYDTLLQQQSQVSSELQQELVQARMLPFDDLAPSLRRVVRQAAEDSGKQAHLQLQGTHGELDRNVLERMSAPLQHLLRNAVVHGLESPLRRREVGKPEHGTITLTLRQEGSEIVLEVADDGAGLDREAIRRRAEQRGLIAADETLRDSDLDNLIFNAGLSTSDRIDQLAGRGVGLEVVRNEVRQLGGSVEVQSVRGHGASFVLRLPQTLAVTQAVFVRIGDHEFAVPVASVNGIGRIDRARLAAGDGRYRYADEDYAVYDLGTLVGKSTVAAEGAEQVPLLLVRSAALRAAVAVDQVIGSREIVVKPAGPQIASVPGIYGATITGDGSVVVILDIAPLLRRHLQRPAAVADTPKAACRLEAPLVMVVDDSLTMRKVTARVLERHNLEVVTARDGVEALERLAERVPDLMLLDIEMPRMDGYELAAAMREQPRWKAVPIVMITSRSGEKHRQRAFELGVQRYLGKPYQELDLMRNVYDLLGIDRAQV